MNGTDVQVVEAVRKVINPYTKYVNAIETITEVRADIEEIAQCLIYQWCPVKQDLAISEPVPAIILTITTAQNVKQVVNTTNTKESVPHQIYLVVGIEKNWKRNNPMILIIKFLYLIMKIVLFF